MGERAELDRARPDHGGSLDQALRRYALKTDDETQRRTKPVDLIAQLAEERYRLGVSKEREPFAVERKGPQYTSRARSGIRNHPRGAWTCKPTCATVLESPPHRALEAADRVFRTDNP